jgi:hypothetical protein
LLFQAIGALAGGDIDLRTNQADGFSQLVPNRNSAGQNPAVTAIGMLHSVFAFELVALAVQMIGKFGEQGSGIVAVDLSQPLLWIPADLSISKTEDRIPARREVDFLSREIPIPQAVASGSKGECVSLFVLSRTPFRFLARRYFKDAFLLDTFETAGPEAEPALLCRGRVRVLVAELVLFAGENCSNSSSNVRRFTDVV